jgi:hypothetical protein
MSKASETEAGSDYIPNYAENYAMDMVNHRSIIPALVKILETLIARLSRTVSVPADCMEISLLSWIIGHSECIRTLAPENVEFISLIRACRKYGVYAHGCEMLFRSIRSFKANQKYRRIGDPFYGFTVKGVPETVVTVKRGVKTQRI